MHIIETVKLMGALAGISMILLGSGWMKQCIRKNLRCHCKMDMFQHS